MQCLLQSAVPHITVDLQSMLAVSCIDPPAGLPGFEPVVLTATLKHHFEAVGGNIVQITFEDTEIKVTGGIGGILVSLTSFGCSLFLLTVQLHLFSPAAVCYQVYQVLHGFA